MMSTIDGMNYNDPDDAPEGTRLRRLAAAGAVSLRAPGASAARGRRARALAGAVPCAAPHRAGPPHADGATRADARLRRLQCDGTGGSARITGPGAAPSVRF